MKYLVAALIAVLGIAFVILVYALIPYGISRGDWGIAAERSALLLFFFYVALIGYLAIAQPEELRARISLKVLKEITGSDLVLLIVLTPLLLGSYWFAASRVGTLPNMLVLDIGTAVAVVAMFFVGWTMIVNPHAGANMSEQRGPKLITTGPYAIVRHPFYLGVSVMAGGLMAMFQNPIFTACWGGVILMLIWRVNKDDQILQKKFPNYKTYQAKTKHRLIPFVW